MHLTAMAGRKSVGPYLLYTRQVFSCHPTPAGEKGDILKMKEIKTKKTFTWYSNENLTWVWGRSLIAMALGFLLIYLIGVEKNHTILIVVVLVPVFLAIFNTFSHYQMKRGG